MYSWIWRNLPGSRTMRVLQALMLVAAVVTLLLLVVFPWLEPRLPFNDVTTGEVTTGAARATTASGDA